MIAAPELYPAMKDYRVPWLGEVPEHWEMRRIEILRPGWEERSGHGTGRLLIVALGKETEGLLGEIIGGKK